MRNPSEKLSAAPISGDRVVVTMRAALAAKIIRAWNMLGFRRIVLARVKRDSHQSQSTVPHFPMSVGSADGSSKR